MPTVYLLITLWSGAEVIYMRTFEIEGINYEHAMKECKKRKVKWINKFKDMKAGNVIEISCFSDEYPR